MTVVICPDEVLIEQQGSYNWTPQNASSAWKSAYIRLGKAALKFSVPGSVLLMCGPSHSGKSTITRLKEREGKYDLIFDATFVTRSSRSAIVGILTGLGVAVDICWVQTPIEVCLDRRAKNVACGDAKSIAVTPAVIDKQFYLFDTPSQAEGFRRITKVSGQESVSR